MRNHDNFDNPERESMDRWMAQIGIENLCNAPEILYLLFEGNTHEAKQMIDKQVIKSWNDHVNEYKINR